MQGFGDAALAEFAHAFIQLRLTEPSLDSAGVRRHLAGRGFEKTLQDIATAAPRLDAPFLRSDVSAEAARAFWSQLFGVLIRLAALERALQDVKSELSSHPNDFAEFYGLKSERDALRRDLGAGTIWTDAMSFEGRRSLH